MTPTSRAFRIRLAYANRTLAVRPLLFQYGKDSIHRFYSAASLPSTSAVVVGAGPGGITVVGNLLEHGAELQTDQRKLVWVDPHFQGGRVHSRYREVPSNTKVGLFVQFANDVSPFKAIVGATPKPNALTALQELPQDRGCRLSYAADMCLMLTDGLAAHPQVQSHKGKVTGAALDERTNVWKVTFDDGGHVTTSKIALCTGSGPVSKTLPGIEKLYEQSLSPVDLDVSLTPSLLTKALDPAADTTVAVVGASHSAILVLINLVNLANSTHPHLRVKWFTRNKLRYAEYMDGWILRDNTGLKGQAAEWARQNLDDEAFPSSAVSKVITKVWTAGKEEEVYKAEMPGCTHIVQAVGYVRNPLPRFEVVRKDGGAAEPLQLEYDNLKGRFYETGGPKVDHEKKYVPGLFGAGIAFPERVTDPHGNVEYAVGFWKFMKFVKKVVPDWVKS
ncbi:hypothetical protein SAMD00023353_0500130 [Rosellinia necatrix]|uniref:FAD-dependent urate hydroxylase HpyO/Asp monooxygenase CreE-like FAD/NAD(P)-binding domain-containing protein n=1 Tax=Rosellinia necatrix TaxID=77044 RepID=A0A1S7UMF4_ROSNE|nr:hypothetical protein SAMD00023353_0500130 [Rosellinia necatrix]